MKSKRTILIVGLTLIISLISLSVMGAFLGAEKTEKAFNSVPFTVFWIFMAVMLLAGAFLLKEILTRPAIFAMHFGFVLIILGSLAGTKTFNDMMGRWGYQKIHKGVMLVFEGQSSCKVRTDNHNIEKHLPFSIKLNDFRIEYYATNPIEIKDYYSDVEIIKDGAVLKTASIEVNKPLHFAGYHFYQHSYDDHNGRFTVLEVVSDSGLYVVYAGFLLTILGLMWHFWVERLIMRKF